VKIGDRSSSEGHHQGLVLSNRVGHDEPLQPAQRVQLQQRTDAGVREVGGTCDLYALNADRLAEYVVEGRELGVRVLHQEKVN